MPTTSERLHAIRLKTERAKHHIHDLETRIQSFLGKNPYRLLCDYDAKSETRTFHISVKEWPPHELALIAGDAVHNMRCALDHLVWQLLNIAGKSNPQCGFPIHEKPPSNEHQFVRKIKGISPSAESLIRELQPYQSGDFKLGALADLDNIDKHNLLYVVGCGVSRMGFRYVNHSLIQQMKTLGFELPVEPEAPFVPSASNRTLILKDQTDVAPVARIAWRGGPVPDENEKLDFSYDIAFAEPQVVRGQAVAPVLFGLLEAVEGVVELFVPHL